jgi:hypothetical protein
MDSGAKYIMTVLVLGLAPICIFILNIFAVRRIMHWLSNSRNILSYVIRSLLIFLPLWGLTWAGLIIIRDGYIIPGPDPNDIYLFDVRFMTWLLACSLVLVTLSFFILASMLLAGGVFATGSICVVSGLLFVAEFVLRRLAEYPKGPVLAASALAGGIAGLIKVFLK